MSYGRTRTMETRPRFGAGIVLLRRREVLLTQRSVTEHEPLTWSCFGGNAELGESPLQCARREGIEESGLALEGLQLDALDVFTGTDYQFHTFLSRVPHDSIAVPSYESQSVGAFPLGLSVESLWAYLPRPLHSGLARTVAKRAVAEAVFAMAY